jgi:hypothetical protein
VDSIDIETIKSGLSISSLEIASGALDSARFTYFIVNYSNLSENFGILRRGTLGQITNQRLKSTVELRGLMEELSKQTLEMYSPSCRADLFDSRCKVPLDPPAWTANTVFSAIKNFDTAVGSTIKPTTPNNRVFRALIAGTSGAIEPVWNVVIGGTTVDGGVTWVAVESNIILSAVTSVSSATKRVFQDTSLVKIDDFFAGGLVSWLTGDNTGLKVEIKRFENVVSVSEIELILSTFFPIRIGDTYTIQAGCTKRLIEDCRGKFNNTHNNRSEPYVPHNFTIARATI